jgi:two-component system chemotaxis sensor kinase CheA
MSGFDSLLRDYALDARERLARIEEWLLAFERVAATERAAHLASLKAELHTLKGNSGMMGLTDLQQAAHAMEDQVAASASAPLDVAALLPAVDRFRQRVDELVHGTVPEATGTSAPSGKATGVVAAPASVRVPFAVLDPLLDQLAELVVLRNRVAAAIQAGGSAANGQDPGRARAAWEESGAAFEALDRALAHLQAGVMGLRLMPLETLFASLQRIVFDVAHREGNQVRLVTEGGETPLDKALLDLAAEALGHLVRNAVVHGIEPPAARTAAGKGALGQVRVRAAARGDEVVIEVADDGVGIDAAKLAEVAAERGVAVAAGAGPFDVLFESGFTTKVATDISAGRGVGLAAVRDAVRRQGGRIEVQSTVGRGSLFRLRLPLSVSILRTMLLRVDGELYALPLAHIVEGRRLTEADDHEVNHAGVMRWRDAVIPLLDLGCHYGTASRRRRAGYVVIVEAFGKHRGLVVDAILGMQEVVVRGLDPILGKPVGVSGSTVLGDGTPILILDARTLMQVEPFVEEAA